LSKRGTYAKLAQTPYSGLSVLQEDFLKSFYHIFYQITELWRKDKRCAPYSCAYCTYFFFPKESAALLPKMHLKHWLLTENYTRNFSLEFKFGAKWKFLSRNYTDFGKRAGASYLEPKWITKTRPSSI
jgi:hypothetical protein